MSAVALGRVTWGLAAIVAVTVGLAAGPLPWRLMGESGLAPPAPPPAAPEAAAVGLEPILALMPFGRRAVPEAPAPVEETGLGLTLHGVVVRVPAARSSAIISGEGTPARAYGLGDEVAAGAVLAAVEGDRVVLDIAGWQETLSFPERRQAAGRSGGAPRSGGGAGGVDALRALVTAQPARPADADAGPDPADAEPSAGFDLEAEIAALRARAQTNPRAVLDGFGLVPGEGGYTVGPGAPEVLLGAGLRPGDVVTTVNGQQVGDVEADQRFLDEIIASGRARVEIVRDGRTIALTFPLR